jgi:pSer/pThr/pTyr-binding forkhead associated (FHA) protein
MRFRLRHMQHDLELAEGQFAVGRNASCQLALDDPLVSRRHAVFTIDAEAVFVEDLQSRNGVLVNGVRIEGPVELLVGDRILIGSQEVTLFIANETEDRIPAARALKMTMPKIPAAQLPVPAGEMDDLGTVGGYVNPALESSILRRAEQFRVLGGVAEKALALGRSAEAERLLASALADVIEASRNGRSLPTELVDEAARFSARLASSTGKGGWADYVIELYQAQDRPPPTQVIAELHSALRKITNLDLGRLQAFVDQIRPRAVHYPPAEKFLFQRLEGLLRLGQSLR